MKHSPSYFSEFPEEIRQELADLFSQVGDTLAEAIEFHQATVRTDEEQFTAEGKAIDEKAATKTRQMEIAAFRHFVAYPCRTASEAGAKIGYLLYGTIGERDRLVDCLADEDYNFDGSDLPHTFLKSLEVSL